MRSIMSARQLADHQFSQHGRDFARSDDGMDDLSLAEKAGWHYISGWGRDGWDLGNPPYVMIYSRNRHVGESVQTGHRFELQSVCEGDHTLYVFTSEEERNAAIDYLFLWYAAGGRLGELVPELRVDREKLDAGLIEVDAKYRGPFTWARSREETQ